MVTIFNKTKNTLIARECRVADTFVSRMTGLLNKNSLLSGEGLMITRCQSIHMFFMRFPIDAIFVDKNDIIVGLLAGIKPFRLSPIFFKSNYVIELPIGTIVQSKASLGDMLELNTIQ